MFTLFRSHFVLFAEYGSILQAGDAVNDALPQMLRQEVEERREVTTISGERVRRCAPLGGQPLPPTCHGPGEVRAALRRGRQLEAPHRDNEPTNAVNPPNAAAIAVHLAAVALRRPDCLALSSSASIHASFCRNRSAGSLSPACAHCGKAKTLLALSQYEAATMPVTVVTAARAKVPARTIPAMSITASLSAS
jgi:hypothetical protein